MIYEHHCRSCGLYWLEEYSLKDLPPDTCPECESNDVFRCVTDSGVIHFKGAGWSPDGYYKNAPLDAWKGRLKLYDREEDYRREKVGEAVEAEKRKLKRQDRIAKRILGYDSRVTEAEAERKIKKAKEKAETSA